MLYRRLVSPDQTQRYNTTIDILLLLFNTLEPTLFIPREMTFRYFVFLLLLWCFENGYSVFIFESHLRRNVSKGGPDHNGRYIRYVEHVLALREDASRIVEAFDVIDSFKIELKWSRCNYAPLAARF